MANVVGAHFAGCDAGNFIKPGRENVESASAYAETARAVAGVSGGRVSELCVEIAFANRVRQGVSESMRRLDL